MAIRSSRVGNDGVMFKKIHSSTSLSTDFLYPFSDLAVMWKIGIYDITVYCIAIQ